MDCTVENAVDATETEVDEVFAVDGDLGVARFWTAGGLDSGN